MKCNKCGTPIILGDSRCRFCGSEVEKIIEIIDSPVEIIEEIIEEAKENVEIIDVPNNVEIIDEIIEAPVKEVIKPEIIEAPVKKEVIQPQIEKIEVIEEKKEETIETPKKIEEKIEPIKNEVIEIKEVKPEIDINEELEKSTSLQRINLEEFTGQLSNIEFNEIQNNIEVEKKEEEKKNVVTTVVEKAFHEKANNFLLVGVLAVVLMLSVTLNGFLYINRYSLKSKKSEEISKNNRIVYFDNYELNIPDNWSTKGITDNNNMLIFDNTNEWGATIEILKNSVFEQTEQYKDEINDSLSKKGYSLTSSYNKETEDMDFYIYKGKYNSYTVYVLVGKINDENAIVTDLKFKGEVDKDILNNIINIVSNISSNDLNNLYENDFEFNRIGDSVKEIIKISEDVVQ